MQQNITLHKMHTSLDNNNLAHYQLDSIEINNLIGKSISMEFTGKITCQGCNNIIKKCYQPGFCFLCTQRLACCDLCIVKPQLCHYHKGTCREPQWGEQNCMQPHIVYLANSSGVKVGITKVKNIPHRWIDQGAIQALPIFEVPIRLNSGQIEVVLSQFVADKTNWRQMLKGDIPKIDLIEKRDEILDQADYELQKLSSEVIDLKNLNYLDNETPIDINYPVLEYPVKITSLNFDKQPMITGKLMGIKGQYFILDSGVLNIRKFSGYEVKLATSNP